MSTSEVHAAIQALYGQNAEQQKAANAFLVQFASTPAAWETALALLGVADPAVQYFGANMLYGKCKSDWATLPEAHREQFSEAVGAHLSRLANAPGSNLAARRLCLVMAAAATRAGPAHAFALVDRALALAAADGASAAPAGVTLALEMQAAIAEETNDAASAAERQALVDALVPRLTDVLGTAERVFEACRAKGSSSGEYGGDVRETGFESLRAAALHAALAWLKLDERGGGGIVLSPGQLASSRGGLLRGALACLGADDAATGDKATEFCVAALAYGAPPSPVPGEDESAVLGMIQALVTSGQTAVGNADQEDFARNICKVAVAVVERDASFAASASAPEACLALTSLVLSLAETHERGIMEACADYFLMLNTVSVAERHPGLRAPLFQRVLAACARHAAFPAGFTTWRDASEDRDAFHRFREQILVDVLDNCFGMCGIAENGGGYLGFVASQLDTIASWQQAESALFLARAASSAAKRLVVRTRAAERERETESETREREGTDAFLRQTLTRIGDASPGSNPAPNSAVFASHPLVVAAAARVIGAYAPWLGHVAGRGDEGGVAIKCAAYLLAALQAPEAFRHASGAFHALCAQCADAFARRDTVTTLLDAAERALPESPPSGEAGEGPRRRRRRVRRRRRRRRRRPRRGRGGPGARGRRGLGPARGCLVREAAHRTHHGARGAPRRARQGHGRAPERALRRAQAPGERGAFPRVSGFRRGGAAFGRERFRVHFELDRAPRAGGVAGGLADAFRVQRRALAFRSRGRRRDERGVSEGASLRQRQELRVCAARARGARRDVRRAPPPELPGRARNSRGSLLFFSEY